MLNDSEAHHAYKAMRFTLFSTSYRVFYFFCELPYYPLDLTKADAGRGLQPRPKRLHASITFEILNIKLLLWNTVGTGRDLSLHVFASAQRFKTAEAVLLQTLKILMYNKERSEWGR